MLQLLQLLCAVALATGSSSVHEHFPCQSSQGRSGLACHAHAWATIFQISKIGRTYLDRHLLSAFIDTNPRQNLITSWGACREMHTATMADGVTMKDSPQPVY